MPIGKVKEKQGLDPKCLEANAAGGDAYSPMPALGYELQLRTLSYHNNLSFHKDYNFDFRCS